MPTHLTNFEKTLNAENLPELLLTPITIAAEQLPQGNLNRNVLFHTADGRPYLLRVENEAGRQQEMPNIVNEYKGVGFLDTPGNTFYFRTVQEQHAFADKLLHMNIPAISPVFSREKMQIIAYCQGASNLADMWKSQDPHVLAATQKAFEQLMFCHDLHIVIGDRWGPNELFLPDGSIRFIDFDIGIDGPEACEFEFVAFMYFLTFFAQQTPSKDTTALQDFYTNLLVDNAREPKYSRKILEKYLTSYPEYFSGQVPYSWNDTSACNTFFSHLRSHV